MGKNQKDRAADALRALQIAAEPKFPPWEVERLGNIVLKRMQEAEQRTEAAELKVELVWKPRIKMYRDRIRTLEAALRGVLACGLPPHDISGQRMWSEAREALANESRDSGGGESHDESEVKMQPIGNELTYDSIVEWAHRICDEPVVADNKTLDRSRDRQLATAIMDYLRTCGISGKPCSGILDRIRKFADECESLRDEGYAVGTYAAQRMGYAYDCCAHRLRFIADTDSHDESEVERLRAEADETATELHRLAKELGLPDDGPQENVDGALQIVARLRAEIEKRDALLMEARQNYSLGPDLGDRIDALSTPPEGSAGEGEQDALPSSVFINLSGALGALEELECRTALHMKEPAHAVEWAKAIRSILCDPRVANALGQPTPHHPDPEGEQGMHIGVDPAKPGEDRTVEYPPDHPDPESEALEDCDQLAKYIHAGWEHGSWPHILLNNIRRALTTRAQGPAEGRVPAERIVQVSGFGVENTPSTQCNYMLVALTESGRVVMSMGDREWADVSPDAPQPPVQAVPDDTQRLDWLEAQGTSGKRWIARESTQGRGYRLHQTTRNGASMTVREAIDHGIAQFEGDSHDT